MNGLDPLLASLAVAGSFPAPVRRPIGTEGARRASRFRAPFRERKTPRGRGAHREFNEVLYGGRRATSGACGARQGARPKLDLELGEERRLGFPRR